MPKQTLKSNLARLRHQLENTRELDGETRQQLVDVADTIEDVLNQPDPDYQQTHESIESLAVKFEARHPNFARILSEVTDALAKLGI